MTTKQSETNLTVDPKLTKAEIDKEMARYLLAPETSSAAVIDAFKKNYSGSQASFSDMIEVIEESTKKLTQDKSMDYVERLLLSQSIALNNLFTSLARKAAAEDGSKPYETNMRLALKAQSQCRATLETLAAVKNPPVIFAKTANIAQNQQINNGAPPAQPPQPIKEALAHDQGEPLPNQIKVKQEAIS
jgi:hypothetical protein